MRKRALLAGLTALPLSSIVANATNTFKANGGTWKVPAGVNKIRVRSWKADGTPDIDRTLNVEPGQVFRIDAIEE